MSNRIPENVAQKLGEIGTQYEDLSNQLLDPEVLADHKQVTALSIKKSAIESLVQSFERYQALLAQESELEERRAYLEEARSQEASSD